MTTLVVEDLVTTLEQNQEIERRLNIERVRLYLLKHDITTGQLTLSVKRNGVEIGSSTIDIADISAATYFHGYVSFVFDNPLVVNRGDVVFELSSSGYTYSSGSYIAWVQEYENITNKIDVEPETDFQYPLTCQIWEYSERI